MPVPSAPRSESRAAPYTAHLGPAHLAAAAQAALSVAGPPARRPTARGPSRRTAHPAPVSRPASGASRQRIPSHLTRTPAAAAAAACLQLTRRFRFRTYTGGDVQ